MKHKTLSFLLAVLMSMVAGRVSAYDAEIDGIYYNLVSKIKQAEVTSGDSKYTGNVTIPSSVTYEGKTYSVTSIGLDAFSGCWGLNTITIPNSVTKIGRFAFSGCRGLTTVTIPNSVTEIGQGVFCGCTGLTSVTIPESVTSIGNSAFYGCSALKNVRLGDGITAIGDWAFSGCSSIDYFLFGRSTETIGKEAFSDCTAMTHLISRAPMPPTCDDQALDDINKWNCTLEVPVGSLTAYQTAPQWKEFFFMEEGTTAVEDLSPALSQGEGDRGVYDLSGRKVADGLNLRTRDMRLPKGIYIVNGRRVVVK